MTGSGNSLNNMLRIIPRLDIKNETVVKGIHLEGLRVVGSAFDLPFKYYKEGADELLYIDAVASLYGRNSLNDVIRKAAKKIFIPLTVGGGIKNIDDISLLLNSGADKVAINTAAVNNPSLIKESANKFGSQCIVISVQAKRIKNNEWEAFTETGRERSGRDVLEWIDEAISLGAGELLLTSIDNDGTKKGFDIDLIKAVTKLCSVPIIISGGVGKLDDLSFIGLETNINALAIGSALHYDFFSITQVKKYLRNKKLSVRE
jgi:imidazole glycerol-phosphate synthase subunit HisF